MANAKKSPNETPRLTRYVALLRGVSPMNAKMAELKQCFENAGFTDVKTVLASGNVVFSAAAQSVSALASHAEAAMQREIEPAFPAIVRSIASVRALLASDPYASTMLPKDAKRVVSFLQKPPKEIQLPEPSDGVHIVSAQGSEVFTAYVPSPRGPVFMARLEKTFGKAITTRTWESLEKIVRAAET